MPLDGRRSTVTVGQLPKLVPVPIDITGHQPINKLIDPPPSPLPTHPTEGLPTQDTRGARAEFTRQLATGTRRNRELDQRLGKLYSDNLKQRHAHAPTSTSDRPVSLHTWLPSR